MVMAAQKTPLIRRSSSNYAPPGPTWQHFNAAIHREPLSSIVYVVFWCSALIVGTPVAIVVLILVGLYRILCYYFNQIQKQSSSSSGHQGYERAVVITGCDTGFGKEFCLWAADAGYTVFAGCLDKKSLLLRKTHHDEQVNGGASSLLLPDSIVPLDMDVTKDGQVQKAAETVRAWLLAEDDDDDGRGGTNKKKRVLHALINNAGVGLGGMVDWMELDDYRFNMEVNFFGMVRTCKAFLPIFKEQAITKTYKGMKILNVTSMAGLVSGMSGLSAYSASKHAANSFSSVLRNELVSFDIQVTTVNPSFHGTPLVAGMTDKVMNTWQKLDTKTKEEYGEAFLEDLCQKVDRVHSITWKPAVVSEKIMDCLKAEHPPPELLIGTDARFVFAVLCMLPAWLVDRILRLEGNPVPAAMEQ